MAENQLEQKIAQEIATLRSISQKHNFVELESPQDTVILYVGGSTGRITLLNKEVPSGANYYTISRAWRKYRFEFNTSNVHYQEGALCSVKFGAPVIRAWRWRKLFGGQLWKLVYER